MIRSALSRALLDQRMERSFARRVIVLVVLVAAIGGTCLAKASTDRSDPVVNRPTTAAGSVDPDAGLMHCIVTADTQRPRNGTNYLRTAGAPR
jgi:hypothetical protein